MQDTWGGRLCWGVAKGRRWLWINETQPGKAQKPVQTALQSNGFASIFPFSFQNKEQNYRLYIMGVAYLRKTTDHCISGLRIQDQDSTSSERMVSEAVMCASTETLMWWREPKCD